MPYDVVRRLRPYLFHGFRRSQGAALKRTFVSSPVVSQQAKTVKDVSHDSEKRLAQLEAYKSRDAWHPRLPAESHVGKMSVQVFQQEYGSLEKDQTDSSVQTVLGRSEQDTVMAYIAHSRVRRQSTISPRRRLQASLP